MIKKLARTLGVSADELLFDEHEGVAAARVVDKELLAQFEALLQMDAHEQEAINQLNLRDFWLYSWRFFSGAYRLCHAWARTRLHQCTKGALPCGERRM